MSSQSCYAPNGTRQRNVRLDSQHSTYPSPWPDRSASQFYHSHAPMSSPESGHYLGAAREMGPPPSFPSDFPALPQPIEIDGSRTLPNPSVSSSTTWDSFSSPGLGVFSEYGSSNIGRPLIADTQVRGNAPNPLQQWYAGNDGPWIPKGISALPEERMASRLRTGNRMPMPYGNQSRQPNPLDAGSFQYGVAQSDSGYGTRHSDGNASVFSADINERDQDCHSLVCHVAEYQPFQGLNNEVVHHRDPRSHETWAHVLSSPPSNNPYLVCPTCQKSLKTRSELKKHDLRHRKPFVCNYPGCTRTEGFSTTNDLERHTKSIHPLATPHAEPTKRYRCHVQGCKSKDKSWPRLDNFRSHLKRVHMQNLQTVEEMEDIIRRAEFWDRPGPATVQGNSSSQKPSFPNSPRAVEPFAQDFLPKASPLQPNWKPMYPEVIEPNNDLLAPKEPMLEGHSAASTPDSNAPASDVRPQETVQPQDVFRPLADSRIDPSSVGSIVLAQVTPPESAITSTDRATSQPAVRSSKVSPQGKATRLNDASTSEAIMEAIVTALVGTKIPEEHKDRSLNEDSDRGNLPHGKAASGGSWSAVPNPMMPSNGKPNDHINPISSPAVQEDSKALHEKKAREVLETLQDFGYIIQKKTTHSPKLQNPGSAAGNKSENIVTCQNCKRFKGRPCELKKHMKRHSRPYGCTFLTCNKTFGSKNDWKRHENSQHFHLEIWRCDAAKLEGGACAKVCYRRQSFQDHLSKEHSISDTEIIKNKVDSCRIGRNCQARFWCGFCTKLIDLTKKGVDAWTERFDHIDDHFMGRHGCDKQGIENWIPVDSDKPKGDAELSSGLSPEKESPDSPSDRSSSGSSHGNSPEASGPAGGSPGHAKSMVENYQGPKRSRSSSDDDSRAAKHQKTTPRREHTVCCCQCQFVHNSKLDQQCTICADLHTFCNNCTYETRPAGQDQSQES